jgi:hypothetical protein
VFDIIGDVHGQFDKLVALLVHLGYRDSGGAWRHPDRSVIFVGDLIDRGPKQFATVDLVRRMVEAGSGRCIMGNHEFNAIAWATPDPEHPGKFLRDHHKPGNREQHQAFLQEVECTTHQKEITDWFKTLPLWLDLGALRIVHACWHQASMDQVRPLMGANQTLTDELILVGSRKGHWAYKAIETICKGPEVDLPDGVTFKDKEGKVRSGAVVAGRFVHVSQGSDRASSGHADDSGCGNAGGVVWASLFRSPRTLWTLLVYRRAESHLAEICLSRLQCSTRRAVGVVSMGRGDGAINGEVGVGVAERPGRESGGMTYGAKPSARNL